MLSPCPSAHFVRNYHVHSHIDDTMMSWNHTIVWNVYNMDIDSVIVNTFPVQILDGKLI
jgi:hypothetical protein